MRRVATVLGGLAMAGSLALSLSGSAWAAQGTLVVNGTTYQDPSGCYNAQVWPLSVTNNTDQLVTVYAGLNCTGGVLALLAPGSSEVDEFGASVSVN
ncbi:hypothetical protein [Actinacidiphila yeochonensis]|uniref:hypothetical protein n=1 Tax=Actinacidiphila yeochonensis TaxID=89050 RepID=UPI00055D7375|nr:hypothetical protein [Actinacidiphila yeochonensis]